MSGSSASATGVDPSFLSAGLSAGFSGGGIETSTGFGGGGNGSTRGGGGGSEGGGSLATGPGAEGRDPPAPGIRKILGQGGRNPRHLLAAGCAGDADPG